MLFTLSFTTITCPTKGCGIEFAVPDTWEKKRREDHSSFYCPNGHSLSFSSKSEVERLRDQLAKEKHNSDQANARADDMRRQRDIADRRRAAMKGQVTRIKNRVGKGVCPCCNRTFQNLKRHMTGQHPDWAPDVEVEPNE